MGPRWPSVQFHMAGFLIGWVLEEFRQTIFRMCPHRERDFPLWILTGALNSKFWLIRQQNVNPALAHVSTSILVRALDNDYSVQGRVHCEVLFYDLWILVDQHCPRVHLLNRRNKTSGSNKNLWVSWLRLRYASMALEWTQVVPKIRNIGKLSCVIITNVKQLDRNSW